MGWSRRKIAGIVRIALFAMLMAVSAPTLSTLLAAACGDNNVGHCHAQPKAHHVAQKCGYCMVQADLPAVPPPPARIALALLMPSRTGPALLVPAALPQQESLAPPSRAPPSA
ncbi:DUF2946 family protein [Duganella sp. CF458]|uniref:DUF2946 family protein n=1 Tax=Duganella sp. CF458 TaxID=1884368 RepID=UPI00147B1A27|nr:DUF2946 family protein [Duganella sp. CF458]